jgi:hypothetical protein
VRSVVQSLKLARPTRCRLAVIKGLRPSLIAVPAPAGARRRVDVAVELEAESNRTRRTLVVQQASLNR